MTNLGAGFSVDSSESAGPTLPSSSGPLSERDRYVASRSGFNLSGTRLTCVLPLCSRQLMPPPSLPVNGARPRTEERGTAQGPVGKGLVLWIDKLSARSTAHHHCRRVPP